MFNGMFYRNLECRKNKQKGPLKTMHKSFTEIKKQKIEELNTVATLFEHNQTGAKVLSLENDDENKVFGITFPTPPADSTGIAHIMEHSVLCGSRKYPLKEPFIELVKGSLQTFLNAMTYPDKTVYPLASQNLKDFYNLVDVYLDSVLYPKLGPEVLKQEGWHLELENADDPIVYKGVVFNEMKGVYSSPDSLLYRYSKPCLFTENTYQHDSGGDPKDIPDLTYEDFEQFHKTYYHPSNALIFFYGDDDPSHRLELLEGYLKDFTKQEVDSSVTLQSSVQEPSAHAFHFDASEKQQEKNSKMTVSWLLPENNSPVQTMAFRILSYILVSTPASPLRKALMDSGLGEDLTGGGLGAELVQLYFSTGLKGIEREDSAKVEDLILDSLKNIAQEGIAPEMLEAAMNTLEFQLRENNTGSYPRGLVLMLRSLTSWIHGHDPIEPLAYQVVLDKIKELLSSDSRYLEKLIETHLINNQHRVRVTLHPQLGKQKEDEEAEKSKLQAIKDSLSPEDIEEIIKDTKELKKRQETPDPPEALALLPSLKLEDLDKKNKEIHIDVSKSHDAEILHHDLFTNGIIYLDLGFDMSVLPQELLPYVTLYGKMLLEGGTQREDYITLAQRIRRKTGGIWPSYFTSSLQDRDGYINHFFLRGKATMDQADDFLAILQDLLCMTKLDNPERFKQLLVKTKAGRESGLIPSGHSVVNKRLGAHFSEAGWIGEQMGGIEHLFFLRDLVQKVDSDWPSVLEKLERIHSLLINRGAMLCNITLDQKNWGLFSPKLNALLTELPIRKHLPQTYTITPFDKHEGLVIPAQVNYVGKGGKLYDYGYVSHGSTSVILRHLRTTWLWDKVRVQGGAYGGMCSFGRRSGIFAFLSYRDPNLLGTIENYDLSSKFLKELHLDGSELTRSVIGAIGALDSYQLPDAQGYTSMLRHMLGESAEYRQQIRDEILGTTLADFHKFGEILEHINKHGDVVVMGSQEALDKANEARTDKLTLKQIM